MNTGQVMNQAVSTYDRVRVSSFETSMNAHVLETLERYKLPFLQ